MIFYLNETSQTVVFFKTKQRMCEIYSICLHNRQLDLMFKEIVIRNFIENIPQCIFRDQCECIKHIFFDFLEDVIPIFI